MIEELVGSSSSDRNWKGIAIAIGVIILVLCGVGISVVLMTPPDSGPRVKGLRFSIKHILDYKFKPRKFNGTWVSDNELVFSDTSGGLSIYNVETSNITQIVSNTIFRRFEVSKFSLSPNRNFLLLAHNLERRYRHSSWAHYTVYEINSGLTWDVSSKSDNEAEQAENLSKGISIQPNKLLYATWLPTSDNSSAIIFIENYTIYHIQDVKEINRKVIPLSVPDQVIPEVFINGIPDWIYEEDILKRDNAVWTSPDGKKLLFATFNDTLVEEVRFKVYGSAVESIVDPYPREVSMRYPKAGSRNPSVSLWMVNLTSSHFEQIRPPLLFRDIEYYFTDISWIASNSISVIWMNRPQNLSLVTHCTPPTWICKEIYRESVGSNAWSTLYTAPKFSSDGSSFLLLAPLRDGDIGNFKHIALVENSQGHVVHPITHGNYQVEEILAWSEQSGQIYFRAIPQSNPSERHIFSISDEWKSGSRQPKCLTCDLPKELFRNCKYNKAIFSPRHKYFVLECLGPDVPANYLMKLDPEFPVPKFVFLLDNNTETLELAAKMAWPAIQKITIPLPGENRIARAKLYLPPELRPDEPMEYPMVIHVYSGPETQLVVDEWKVDFNTYLSSGLSYVVLEVDASGSGGQGEKKMTEIKNKLGQLEVQDQLDAARFIAYNLSFVDPERIAVTGVSYGGYVAGLMLADLSRDLLQCGVAVSPVVDWRFYESAYTERYMGFPTPTGNYRGYQDGSLISRAKNFRGKAFLLAHGMADKNVHFQNSVLLAKSLVYNNVPFEQHFYADEDHFLEGVQTHLYTTVSRFLERCLYKPDMSDEDGQITYEYKKGHLVASYKERDEDDFHEDSRSGQSPERNERGTNQSDPNTKYHP